MAAMGLHGDFADSELVRNLLIPQTRDNQAHNFAFAVAETRVTLLKCLYLRCSTLHCPAAIQSETDCFQQRLLIERLGQELRRASLHRPHGHRHVAVGADKDDRHVGSVTGELLLEIEASEARKQHLENQAARAQLAWIGKKRFRGRK